MPRLSLIAVPMLAACLSGFWCRPARSADEFVFHHENVMGTSLELRVKAGSAAAARGAEERVLREIDRLSAVFSGYDRESEFSRWQRSSKSTTTLSPELFELLDASDQWRIRSRGAFDPRVEALSRLWSSCAKVGRTPTPAELDAVKALMRQDAWRLDPSTRSAARISDCPLTLNAIAKGYIVEHACQAALDPGRGVRGLLLNVGGDMRVCGDAVHTIGIASPTRDSESAEPLTTIEVRDRSVATSGNSQRGLRINGRWYSHIFDPRTGRPVERTVSATVIAQRSADADALATVFNVLSVDESLKLAKSLPGVECLLVTSDGREARSEGFGRYETRRLKVVALADGKTSGTEAKPAPGGTWNDDFELLVQFEINRPEGEGRGVRRPYVAIWVEDKEGFPVRNLILWVSQGGAGPFQWLPDLKRWYRGDQARKLVDKTDMIQTIARPTRSPGKYSVIWDGKDDHGKRLNSGEYTLYIEAAREHGTYQSIRKPLTLADKPFAEELKGNVELKSASIEYRRKGPAK
jgi:FAD:protein FMN transferase